MCTVELWDDIKVFATYRNRLRGRAAGILASLENGLDRIMQGWLVLAGLASAVRILVSPMRGPVEPLTIGPYLLLVLAPLASMVLALRWFADGDRLPQPANRLSHVGRWRSLSRGDAVRHPLYGPNGIMVSLLVGMLLNVPVRAAEYLMAMPALTGPIPSWLSTLNLLMTVDVVVFTSLYTIAFVAALRRVPLFPRLLAVIWVSDLSMQIITGEIVSGAPGLPPKVADALHALLEGNAKKVLISVSIWLPYLLLSRRVNVTYRHRVPAT